MLQALVVFLLGASVGSFINVVADRMPQGQSWFFLPSHCPACGRRLTPWELVPVFSYLALRGRCYQCKAPIPLRVLGVELIVGLLVLYLWLTSGISVASLLLLGYICLFLLLGAIDLDYGIVPNILVYPGLGLSLLLAPWWGHLGVEREFFGFTAPGYLLLGSVVGVVVAGGFFALVILLYPQGMGWGDVKMAGLIGLAIGIPGALVALLAAVLSGGLVAGLLLALRRRSRKEAIPFAPFLTLGAVLALLWGDRVWGWYLSLY